MEPGPRKSAPDDDLSGQTHGDFRFIRRLGQGGMGQVYLAEQLSLKRQVAIKFLKSEHSDNANALTRFRAEAEAIAKISHPNIVQVYTIGEMAGMPFMALEYVQGVTLRDYLGKKGATDLPRGLLIMRQVAAALQRAGEIGIVHRDIKPENILLTRKGEVKVTDFGLSREFREDKDVSLTQSGITMGTPLYMSPEQAQGKPVDSRSDIYSFGVTSYHLLAGNPPFSGANAVEVALKHVNAIPPPLADARPDLPIALTQLVHRMMAKKPDDRPQTGRDVLRELGAIREGDIAPDATSPITDLADAVNSEAPSFTVIGQRIVSGKWILIAVLSMAAILAGVLHQVLDRVRSKPSMAIPAPGPSEDERFLVDMVHRFSSANLSDAAKQQAALRVHLQLALLYLDQRRLPELESLAAKMTAREGQASFIFLGNLLQGIFFSFMDEPNKSNTSLQLAFDDKNANKYLNQLAVPPSREVVDLRAYLREALDRNEVAGRLPQDLNRIRAETIQSLRNRPGAPFGKKGNN